MSRRVVPQCYAPLPPLSITQQCVSRTHIYIATLSYTPLHHAQIRVSPAPAVCVNLTPPLLSMGLLSMALVPLSLRLLLSPSDRVIVRSGARIVVCAFVCAFVCALVLACPGLSSPVLACPVLSRLVCAVPHLSQRRHLRRAMAGLYLCLPNLSLARRLCHTLCPLSAIPLVCARIYIYM